MAKLCLIFSDVFSAIFYIHTWQKFSRGDGVTYKTGGVHREKYDLLLHNTSEDSDDEDLDAIEFVGPQLV